MLTRFRDHDYQPFPNVPRRNYFQEHLEIPLLLRLLGPPRGGAVLEVGCGRGIALPVLAERLSPARLVGLDIDGVLLDAAAAHLRSRGTDAELVDGDVRDLPFPDASFDLILDFGTCHHIRAPDRALREIARVLKPGGLFIAETVSSQLLSHPIRTAGRRLPWRVAPTLRLARQALLWKARRKVA